MKQENNTWFQWKRFFVQELPTFNHINYVTNQLNPTCYDADGKEKNRTVMMDKANYRGIISFILRPGLE